LPGAEPEVAEEEAVYRQAVSTCYFEGVGASGLLGREGDAPGTVCGGHCAADVLEEGEGHRPSGRSPSVEGGGAVALEDHAVAQEDGQAYFGGGFGAKKEGKGKEGKEGMYFHDDMIWGVHRKPGRSRLLPGLVGYYGI
jgi:hypothetical protein